MIFPLDPLKALLVFLGAGLADVVWALYIRRAGEGRAASAGFLSMIIILFGAYITIEYVDNHWYLLPAVIGAFIGTYFTVKADKKNADNIRIARKLP
jgi:hypothetical protein